MFKKIKQISLVTKILYLLAVVLFFVWALPTMMNYYSNLNKYKKEHNKIAEISSKYGISSEAQPFSVNDFKKSVETTFLDVTIVPKEEAHYSVDIKIRKDDLKEFHTFIETLSLRYLVQIKDDLVFKANDDDTINIKMTLVEL